MFMSYLNILLYTIIKSINNINKALASTGHPNQWKISNNMPIVLEIYKHIWRSTTVLVLYSI